MANVVLQEAGKQKMLKIREVDSPSHQVMMSIISRSKFKLLPFSVRVEREKTDPVGPDWEVQS